MKSADQDRDPPFALLRTLLAAADLELPDEDLPALADAYSNQRAALEQLRTIVVAEIDISGRFDASWS